MSSTRERGRVLILAAIMVLSVVAMSSVFAGSVAAQDHNVLIVTDNPGEDEYATLPAALDAASPGDEIQVQDDQTIEQYDDNRIIVEENGSGDVLDGVSIVADGDVTIRFNQDENTNNPGDPVFDVRADNVRIEGFTIELDTDEGYGGSQRTAQGVKVGGFEATGGSDVEIVNNEIVFVGDDNENINTVGVGLIDPNDGGELDGATVKGNSIEGFNTGILAYSTDDGLTGEFTFGDNILENNSVQYIDNSDAVDGSAVFEGNVFDNAALVSSSTSYNDAIYSSIDSAVDDTQEDSTVEVGPGTYNESVTISTDNITLVGADSGTVFDGGNETDHGLIVDGAANVTLQDFKVTNYSSNGIELQQESDGDIANLTVIGVTAVDNHMHGLAAQNGYTYENIVFKSVNMSENTGEEFAPGLYNGRGLYILNAPVDNMKVVNSTFSNNGLVGLDFNEPQQVDKDILVHNVSTAGNGDVGISFHAVNDSQLVNSHLDDGVDVNGVANLTIANNMLSSNGGVGAGVRFRWVYGAHDIGNIGTTYIQNNTFTGSTGIFVGEHDETPPEEFVEITRNDFGGTTEAVNNTQDVTVDATLNWWGDYDGITGPHAGGNDFVVGTVDYEPFLTVPIDEIEVDDISETTKFAHDLVVPAGTPTAVGFPGPTDQTIADAFSEFDGVIYKWDDGWTSVEGSEQIDALEAFVAIPDEGADDVVVNVEYAPEDVTTAPEDITLEQGYNFIAPAIEGDANDTDTLGLQSGETLYGLYSAADQLPHSSGFNNFQGTSSDPIGQVSPFTGYFVHVPDGDRSHNAHVTTGVTANDIHNQLSVDPVSG